MKPASFEYVRPRSVSEVCALLQDNFDSRIIAGGQTLIPMLAMRLSRPSLLIDIHRIADLRRIECLDDRLVLGAALRQREAEFSAEVASSVPLLAKALPWVGHLPTRNRGTIGGSIANADPSAEIPLVAITLGAEIALREGEEDQVVPAEDFFIGAMVTMAAPEACLTSVSFPIWSGDVGVGFAEISARKSDFAFASAASQIQLAPDRTVARLALGVGGVEDRPVRIDMDQLIGVCFDAAKARELIEAGVEHLYAESDLHASAAYRKRAAVQLACKAFEEAHNDALKLWEANREH